VGIGSFRIFKELQEPVLLSLFRGLSLLSRLLVRRLYPSVQQERVSSLTTLIPLFPQTFLWECAHLCNVDGHLLPQPPSYRERRDVSVPVCTTWTGISSRPSHPPLLPAGACPSVQHGMPPPPATPFPVERVRLCNEDQHLLSNPPPRREHIRLCNMGRHLLTSLSSLLLLSPPDTPGGRLIRRGNRLPSRPLARRLACRGSPRALRPATHPRLASRDSPRALRPAT
jgi:hypothetical protein